MQELLLMSDQENMIQTEYASQPVAIDWTILEKLQQKLYHWKKVKIFINSILFNKNAKFMAIDLSQISIFKMI